METHVRVLASFSIAFGVLSGLAGFAVLLYFRGVRQLYTWAEASGGLGFVVTGTVLFHVLVAVPMILGGIFLRQFTDRARLAMVFLCALNMLNIPFGTLLGGYGLWVLLTPETEPLFSEREFRRHRPERSPN